MDVIKSKVLVGTIHNLHIGGAQKMMISILNYFSTQAFEVHLIVFTSDGILKRELAENIIVHELNSTSIGKGMFKCLKLIHKLKASVIFSGIGHLNLALAPFIPFMKRLLPHSKWIARETNIVSLQNKDSKYPKLFDWLYRNYYDNYDKVIVQSEDMKKDLKINYGVANSIVINNPLNIEKIKKLANLSLETEFNKDKINLLSVAGLRKEKRHDLMLEVLSLLPIQYHLTIVGSGEKEVTLKKLAQDLKIENRITFLGYQVNPYTYMKRADLFLLTSEREGFPNVLLEANALGLPIIAFACKGGIEEIINQGVNGFYVPFSKSKTMAKKIEEASIYNFNTNSIIEYTIKSYSYENILSKYKEIFLNK